MEQIDKSGMPRSMEQLVEAREAVKKALVDIKNISPVVVHYPCIIEALQELIGRRVENVL